MRKPFVEYNGHKFYDLDDIPLYISTIEDFYERKHVIHNIRKQINENAALYEMAKARSAFIRLCADNSTVFHYTVANIICLEDNCPEIINHWKHEIITFTTKIITGPLDKSVNRTRIVIEQLISDHADLYKDGYSYLDSLVYEEAMIEEIKKARRPNATLAHQKIAKYIKTDILPIIDDYVNPNKDRVYKLFNGLIKACQSADILIFKKSLDEFILNE